MVTRRDFLKQIGMAAVGGAVFAARVAQIKEPATGGVVNMKKLRNNLISLRCSYEKCQTCQMPKCASTTINVQTVDVKQFCEMLDANKQGIAEIIQTGNLNGRKVFYKVDHKMGPSRVPLSPIS